MKKYEHLFFDLDRTLWDFEQNSAETLTDLFIQHKLEESLKISEHLFIETYKKKNDDLWAKYRKGVITKDSLRLERFHQTLCSFGLNDSEFALSLNDGYVAACSSKTNLIPYAKEVLDYLKPNYKLHVITNGFVEAQFVKIEKSGLKNYFDEVIVSDGLGYRKPDKRIFEYAFTKTKTNAKQGLMIGDDYVPDVLGARNVGMDQVYFNAEGEIKEATFCISSLLELKAIL